MTKSAIPQDVVIADLQKNKAGYRIRLFWFAGVFTAFVFGLVILAGWHIVVTLAPYVLSFVGLVVLLLAGVFFYELVQGSKTRHKEHNARRRIIEAKAREQEAIARKAEFFTYSRSEGVIQHTGFGYKVLALPMPNNAQQTIFTEQSNGFDFFELMTQVRKAYAIFGRQQCGKTTTMHHLVRYWQDKNIQPVVIGQKFDTGEYDKGVMRFGPDETNITESFNLIRQEANERQRLAQRGQSFGDMLPLPVILEDASSLNSIVNAKDFETFMRQILTVYAARLIVVYLVVHSMDLSGFGLKVGASLKNALTCLYFNVPDDKAVFSYSDVTVTASIGYKAQESERYPVTGLPAGLATLTDDCQPALYSLAVDMPKMQMTKTERRVLRLYGQDWTVSQIAKEIYDTASSHNNGKVKDVLSKFNVPVRDARQRVEA